MTPEPVLPRGSFSEPTIRLIRLFTVLVFGVAGLLYVAFTWRWRMAVDTPVMHYVVFLMRHGLQPYSDITDNNMPGAYLTEAAAMTVFGGSDLSWRVYEFVLMAVFVGSAAFIARRWDWVAGIFGAGTFLVLHSAEGPQLAVERELVIGVLLMVACACLFAAVQRRWIGFIVFFGFLCGVAVSIKPTYLPLPFGLLALAVIQMRDDGKATRFLIGGLLGLALAVLVDVAFLAEHHAWKGFHFILTTVLPAYSGISRMPLLSLLANCLPRAVSLLFLGCLPLLWLDLRGNGKNDKERSGQRSWQWWALVATAAFGLLSYLAQGKGSVYHRYVFLMFLLLLVGIEIFTTLARPGPGRWLAAALLGLTLFFLVPLHLRHAKAVVGQSSFEFTLERDLQVLGGSPQLDGKVQCFDLVFGCLNALYHLNLVENTGFTGDMLLFPTADSEATHFYQNRFWQLAQQDPADVLVISNGIIAEPNNYRKLERWPAFDRYLSANYTLAVERRFSQERYGYHEPQADYPPTDADSYRLYVRDNSALRTRLPELPTANVPVMP